MRAASGGASPRMANAFYDPGAARGEKVCALFARIASRYDLINDLQSFGLHRRWKRRVADLARVQPGDTALDVCCGTGDIAFELARRGAQVTGLDFSEPMLKVARGRGAKDEGRRTKDETRAARRAATGPAFLQGDAMKLPFADASFDVVTVGYGLRNLADWQTGLREMIRVARPGGRLLVLEFGKPDNAVWRGLYFAYLRCFVPLLGVIFCGQPSAYAYILESLRHYPAQRGLEAAMREWRLAHPVTVNLLGGVMSINVAEKPMGKSVAKLCAA